MSIVKSFTFSPLPQRQRLDPRLLRRSKLIDKLEEQRKLSKDPNFTSIRRQWRRNADGTKELFEVAHRPKQWWRTDSKGSVVLSVRYGFSQLEFEKGKPGIHVGKQERLDAVLTALVEAVRNGEVDALLDTASRSTTPKRAAKEK